jgi:3-oxoacyl-[acyl-carrier-protein] synthase-1
MASSSVFLPAMGIISALGTGLSESRKTLFQGQAAHLSHSSAFLAGQTALVALAPQDLPALPLADSQHRTRTNQLLWAAAEQILPAIEQARHQLGPQRIGVIIGTSTAGVNEATAAYCHAKSTGALPQSFSYHALELGGPAEFLRDALRLAGPTYGISTACSSSAKALSAAARMIAANLCDAVVVGGADSLCALTVNGFNALQSVSPQRCNPLSRNRDGITIGEGAAVFLMTRAPADIALMGVGESSDAHHPNAPHPQGTGAIAAMTKALRQAGLSAANVAYVNLHGTATPLNDAMEAKAVQAVFGPDVFMSSTKPMTGHTLGAAGAIEAAVLWLSLSEMPQGAPLPRHLWDGDADPDLPPLRLIETTDFRLPPCDRMAMLSNSFAFGGSNAAVLLGRGYHGDAAR